MNNSLCDITGYTVDELTGQDTRILFLDDAEYLRIGQELYKSREGNRVDVLESQFRKRDGSIIDVVLSLSPFDPVNPDAGVTATIMDVTERKRSEEALKRANNQVALLTSVTRHDILNKLTALRGYIRYMRKLTVDDSLAEIIQKEEDLAVLIANLINFTRDFKNVGITPPEWIEVADTITTLRKSMAMGPVSLHVNTDHLQIYADPQMRRVFSNLIDNSLRHGGPVTEIRITSIEREDHRVIMYEDNGAGIPDDEKELIFEREYRRNTGFGLFLAREILAITMMTITETGKPGHGVRFEITIPQRAYRFNDPQ
jgi:PAS domain S-box-containing protein